MRFLKTLLLLPVLLFAYSDYYLDYNKPFEKWYRTETDHFNVIYLSGLKAHAEEAAAVGEEVYAALTGKYGLQLPKKLDLIIYDEDYSNGYAWASANAVKVWIAGEDMELRGMHHWLRDVVVHELAHIVSIQAGQKTRYNIPDIRFGYFDYFNEKSQASFFTVYSFDIFPMWFAEGIAQYESSLHGSDTWDAHRDMIMREKALNDKLLPLSQMNFFIGRGIDYESGPYNQGFSMVRYIAKTYGEDALARICRASASPVNVTFSMAVKSALGISIGQLYDDWAKAEKAKYAGIKTELGTLSEGKKLCIDSNVVMGYRNLYPRWGTGDKKLYFISNGRRDGGRGALSEFDFSDTIKKEEDRYKPVFPIVSDFFSFSDSDRFVTHSSPNGDPTTGEGYVDAVTDSIPKDKFLDGLFLSWFPDKSEGGHSVSKIRRWLTYFDHARQACINHRGDRVAAVRKQENRYSLALIDNKNIAASSEGNGFWRIVFDAEFLTAYRKNPSKALYSADSSREAEFLIYTPRFSPNDSLIVFSYFDGTNRHIGLTDTNGHFTPLLATPFDERDPDFTPDGKSIVFSADYTGIFNLYRMELATGKTERLTNVAGGAFCPAVSGDNGRIAYSNFDSSGFTLYLTENKAIDTVRMDTLRKQENWPAHEGTQASSPRNYYPTLSRVLFSPMVVGEEMVSANAAATQGKSGIKLGGLLWLSDPLEKNSLMLMALMEVNKGFKFIGADYAKHIFFNPAYDKDLMLLYENRSFTPRLSFEADKFLIHQNEPFYNVTTDRYEDNNYVVDIQRYLGHASFQLLSNFRKLHFALAYSKHNIDFYELAPGYALEYSFFQEWNPSLYWTYLKMSNEGGAWRQEDPVDPRGTYFKFKWDYLHDSIMVDGSSWQESFEIVNGTTIHPKYHFQGQQRLRADYRYDGAMPLLSKLTVGGEAQASVADRPIDNFVYPGVFMKSYPYLTDQSHLAFLGRNTARAEAHLRFPIARRIRTGLGPFLFDKLYGMAYVEAGWAAGIDPTENGRSDLDVYARQGRQVDYYMARLPTDYNNGRTPVRFATKDSMLKAIAALDSVRPGFVFDERDKHVVYTSLPDDTVQGFIANFKTLLNTQARVGFGLELRMENYITPGYPFFFTLRYSQQVDRDDPSASVKDFFTKSIDHNSRALLYFNIGFSFDGWDLIDVPDASRPARY